MSHSHPIHLRHRAAGVRFARRTGGRGGARRVLALSLLCVTGLLLPAGGCATNPATGESQLSLISEEQEVQMGQEAAAQLEASGALYEDPDLSAYVSRIGQRLASQSERPDLPWTFGVIDDTSINAFALPGGYVYLTRGILAHFENEAQLAGVLGHEIGHVTARHHASQATRSQLAQLGLGIGMVLSPELRSLGGLAETGLGLLLMSHGRDAEREADRLGIGYMRRAAYEPSEMVEVLAMLDRTAEASGGGRLPGWLSTHPAPGERIDLVRGQLADDESGVLGGDVGRERYLEHLEGMVYGPNPEDGVVVGARFLHPELGFQLRFPEGWQVLNQEAAVVGQPSEQDALMALSFAEGESLEAAAEAIRGSQGLRVSGVQRVELAGLPARAMAFDGQTEQGAPVQGTIVLVAHEGRIFQLIGYAPESRWPAYERPVERALQSFEPLDPRYRDLEPQRMQVLAIEQPMTLRDFDARHPSSIPLEELALLNQVSATQRLPAGTRVKRIVGGALPEESEPAGEVLGRSPRAAAVAPGEVGP